MTTIDVLVKLPENKFCADCRRRAPRWATVTFGVFICDNCAGSHRSLGAQTSFVKSVTLDNWKPHEVQRMLIGNERSNAYFEAHLNTQRPKPDADDMAYRHKFVTDKYVKRLFAPRGLDPPQPRSRPPSPDPNSQNSHPSSVPVPTDYPTPQTQTLTQTRAHRHRHSSEHTRQRGRGGAKLFPTRDGGAGAPKRPHAHRRSASADLDKKQAALDQGYMAPTRVAEFVSPVVGGEPAPQRQGQGQGQGVTSQPQGERKQALLSPQASSLLSFSKSATPPSLSAPLQVASSQPHSSNAPTNQDHAHSPSLAPMAPPASVPVSVRERKSEWSAIGSPDFGSFTAAPKASLSPYYMDLLGDMSLGYAPPSSTLSSANWTLPSVPTLPLYHRPSPSLSSSLLISMLDRMPSHTSTHTHSHAHTPVAASPALSFPTVPQGVPPTQTQIQTQTQKYEEPKVGASELDDIVPQSRTPTAPTAVPTSSAPPPQTASATAPTTPQPDLIGDLFPKDSPLAALGPQPPAQPQRAQPTPAPSPYAANALQPTVDNTFTIPMLPPSFSEPTPPPTETPVQAQARTPTSLPILAPARVESNAVCPVVLPDVVEEPAPPRLVRLNVGGTLFHTTPRTLLSHDPASLLAKLATAIDQAPTQAHGMHGLPAPFVGMPAEERGGESSVFVDRDPVLFRHILNYLRNGHLPTDLFHHHLSPSPLSPSLSPSSPSPLLPRYQVYCTPQELLSEAQYYGLRSLEMEVKGWLGEKHVN